MKKRKFIYLALAIFVICTFSATAFAATYQVLMAPYVVSAYVGSDYKDNYGYPGNFSVPVGAVGSRYWGHIYDLPGDIEIAATSTGVYPAQPAIYFSWWSSSQMGYVYCVTTRTGQIDLAGNAYISFTVD